VTFRFASISAPNPVPDRQKRSVTNCQPMPRSFNRVYLSEIYYPEPIVDLRQTRKVVADIPLIYQGATASLEIADRQRGSLTSSNSWLSPSPSSSLAQQLLAKSTVSLMLKIYRWPSWSWGSQALRLLVMLPVPLAR
jgi:hypothetical protein